MSSLSYWHQSAQLPAFEKPQFPSARQTITTDICIVGAGIVGSSAAWHLAQRGHKALVVDMREPSLGASGRNAGMIVASVADNYREDVLNFGHDRAKALKELAVENRERLIDLAVRLNVPIWRSGFIYLADNLQEYEAFEEIAGQLNRDGFKAIYHAEDPLGRGFHGGLESPDEAVTHPALLNLQILLASNQELLPYTKVKGIEQNGDRVRLICDGIQIDCGRVLIATNAYTKTLFPEMTANIQPCRGQIQVSEVVPMVVQRGLGSQFGYYYYRQIPDPARPGYGRWLMGGARNVNFESENNHYDESPTADVQNALTRYTKDYFPELAGIKIDHQWGGTMGFTKNHLPFIGRLPHHPQIGFCVGFSGHGMGLGHISALKAVEMLLDDRPAWPFMK